MYSCNNCYVQVSEPQGRCPGCNIHLSHDNVTPLRGSVDVAPDRDLQVSHRCSNCGDTLIDDRGKCSSCRFPIPSVQREFTPKAAEVIALRHRTLSVGHSGS